MQTLLNKQFKKLQQKRYKYILPKYSVSLTCADTLREACTQTLVAHEMKIRQLITKLKEDYLQFYTTRSLDHTKACFYSNLFCSIDVKYLPEKQFDVNSFDTYEMYRVQVRERTLSGYGVYKNTFSHNVLIQLFDFLSGTTEKSWCTYVNFDLTDFYGCLYDAIEDGVPQEVKDLIRILHTNVSLSVYPADDISVQKGDQMFLVDKAYLTYSCREKKVKVFLQSETQSFKLSMIYASA